MSIFGITNLKLLLFVQMTTVAFGQAQQHDLLPKLRKIFSVEGETTQVDEEVSVSVKGCDGYRFILRHGRRDFSNLTQQTFGRLNDPNGPGSYEIPMKYSYVDLLLFPEHNKIADGLIQEITWKNLEQAYYAKPVYMGTGDGYHWFANCTLSWQERVRDQLGLIGGENRVELLVQGLLIKDSENMTRDAALKLLVQHGDAAIPHLKRFIDEELRKNSRHVYAYIPDVFNVLGKIHTDKSTALIREYYGVPNTRGYAALALSHKPYRPKAKDEYIDILKGKYGKFQRFYAVEACVEYDWKDALPYIREICEKPFTWHDFRTAYRAEKTLEGDPISNEMIKAYNAIRRNLEPDAEKAKEIILQLPDRESAAVFAIDLLFMGYKTRTQQVDAVHDTAWDILRALPRETTKPLVGRLLNSMHSGSKRAFSELEVFFESY